MEFLKSGSISSKFLLSQVGPAPIICPTLSSRGFPILICNSFYHFSPHPGPSETGFKVRKVKKIRFHFYLKSEKVWLSLFFEKCKVKSFCFPSFSRSESEMKMTRDREVKFLENFREIFFFQNQA